MIIELSGDYGSFKKYELLFYKNEDDREKELKEAENIAYRQLADELRKFGRDNLIPNIGAEHADYSDGGLCIRRDGNYWLVYHSEHYQKSELALFSSPYKAASYYLWSVVADPSKESTSVGMIPRLGTF